MNAKGFEYDPKGHSKHLYYSKSAVMNWVHAAHINEAVARSRGNASAAVLDVGCSDGEYFYRLQGHYSAAVGLDHNGEALKTLLERMPDPHTVVLQGDACNLPFPNHGFDVVASLETLEHVYDMPRAVAEFQRVLKPGGALIVTVPIERGLSILLKQGVSKLCFGGYRGSYTWAELWNAAIGNMEAVERPSLSSHKGFDYQTVIDEIQARFVDVRVCGLPFKPFGAWFNTQMLVSAKKPA